MKKNDSVIFRWQSTLLILAVVLFALLEPAHCRMEGTALLLQQTPEGGGTVTPAVGVHHFEQGTEVILTAIAQPGYQFVCWLGDVSDAMAGTTAVYLDTPKIVIAVFEQAKFEFAVFAERSQSAPGGGLYRKPGEITSSGFGGPGAKRPSKRRGQVPVVVPTPTPFPTPYPDDFPIPEEGGDEFPIPEVPEPATICLFGLGSFILIRKRRA